MLKSLFSRSITIPTLRLSGVIGQSGYLRSGLSIANLDKMIDKLFADKKSPAVALIVNSPGGSPTQSSLIASKIIKKSKEKIVLTFISKSFLQNQVRSMVGCLKYLGENKWTINDLKSAMRSKKRSNCAPPAPPFGLYLQKIQY